MCRALRADTRQYGLFRYFDKVLPCGLGCGQVVDLEVYDRADECAFTLNQ